jgi:hypothetical protein
VKQEINPLSQWLAFQKLALELKLKANVIAVYHALLYAANKSFWDKEIELVRAEVVAMAGIDEDVYTNCLKILFDNGILEMWQKGSNRYIKAKVTLKILYNLDTGKADSRNILPTGNPVQVDTGKADSRNILPTGNPVQVDTGKAVHYNKQVNSSQNKTIKPNKESCRSPDVININGGGVFSDPNSPGMKKEKGCAEKEKSNPGNILQIDTPLNEAIKDFIDMRKKIRKPPTDRALQLIMVKLDELSSGDENLKVQILQQSIVSGWQDVFPLRIQNKTNTRVSAASDRSARNQGIEDIMKGSVAFLQGDLSNPAVEGAPL